MTSSNSRNINININHQQQQQLRLCIFTEGLHGSHAEWQKQCVAHKQRKGSFADKQTDKQTEEMADMKDYCRCQNYKDFVPDLSPPT